MSDRHLHNAESSTTLIPDELLGGFVGRAIRRAGEISWPLFFALRYSETELVSCFDASISIAASEFLRNCAERSFPRHGCQTEFLRRERCYAEITDRELRGALENAIARSSELNFWCFADLVIAKPGWARKRLEFCLVGNIPHKLAMDLHGWFDKAIMEIISSGFFAPRSNESPQLEN